MEQASFYDQTGKAVLLLHGAESLDFLQRISTNDLNAIDSKGSVQTMILNEKGRFVEVLSVVREGRDRLLLAGQSRDPAALKGWLEKFIIMEDILIQNLTSDYERLCFLGFDSSKEAIFDGQVAKYGLILRESWGMIQSHSLLLHRDTAAKVKELLVAKGFKEVGSQYYEEYRILRGIPVVPNELNDLYNPLEAGLRSLISWTKGCYVGQEVIARLDTYKKVQRNLVRFRLPELPAELPADVYCGDQMCGALTSGVRRSGTDEYWGLGFVKTEFQEVGQPYHFKVENRTVDIKIDPTGERI